MKFSDTLTEIIKVDLEINAVPALMGEPGIGKSSFVIELARTMGTKAFILACNQLADKADLTGARLVPYTKDDGSEGYKQVFYPHQTVQEAIDYARANPNEYPILHMDEINRSTSDVTSASLTMITERRLGNEVFPPNLRIMVSGNTKGNVIALDDASISRFSIYEVEPDAQTLIEILGSNINPHVLAVLTKYPHLVFDKSEMAAVVSDGTDDDDATASYADLLDSGEEMSQITTPRTIDGISRWLNAVDPQKIAEYLQTQVVVDGVETTLLNEVIEAHIGRTEFATHLVNEIASAAAQGTVSQSQGITVPKPNCYKSLKQAPTINDLADIIGSLTDREKAQSIVYALFEQTDNTVLLQQLAQQVSGLDADNNRLILQLAGSSRLNDRNVDAFVNTQTPVAVQLKSVFDMVN